MLTINNKKYIGEIQGNDFIIQEFNYGDDDNISKREIVRFFQHNFLGLEQVFGYETKSILFSTYLVSIEFHARQDQGIPAPKEFQIKENGADKSIWVFVDQDLDNSDNWICYYYTDYKTRSKKYFAVIEKGDPIPRPFNI